MLINRRETHRNDKKIWVKATLKSTMRYACSRKFRVREKLTMNDKMGIMREYGSPVRPRFKGSVIVNLSVR